MFEKKIKDFFNSVTVCGEFPAKKQESHPKRFTAFTITAGVACLLFGTLLATKLLDKVGEETDD